MIRHDKTGRMSGIVYLICYFIVGAQNVVIISRISIILANTGRESPWLGGRDG